MSYGSKYIGVFNSVYAGVFKALHLGAAPAPTRWAYNFDGIDDRGVLAFRAINPDGDINIEFYVPNNINLGSEVHIVTQNISGTPALREFCLFIATSGNLGVVVGGVTTAAALAGTFIAGEKLRFNLTGTTLTVFRVDGSIVRQITYTRGTAREPTAVTSISCRASGSSAFSAFASGVQRDIKINGKLWPVSERNQTIQLPSPSGLGAELITKAVLENPANKANQWTYLGEGRWQLQGTGAYESLRFISDLGQVVGLIIEFEVESITGTLRLNPITAGYWTGTNIVNQVGKYRLYSNSSVINNIEFVRHNSGELVNCIIKNISFKTLNNCNPLILVNSTPERWEKVAGVLPFTRFAYDFDGIDDRGQLAYRAINPDGDIFINWKQKNLQTTAYTRVIVSQQISGSVTSREFLLGIGTGGQIVLQLGGVTTTTGSGNLEDGYYEFSLIGTTAILKRNGQIVTNTTFTRGTARELLANTTICALTAGSSSVFGNWFAGQVYDVQINGVLWPLDIKGQSLQLPLPTGLGSELANFSTGTLQTGWSYSNGTFTANAVPAFQPSTSFGIGNLIAGREYFIELNVLSVTGTFRVQVTGGTGQNLTPNISTAGVYRYVFTANANNTSCGFQATVNNTSCIVTGITVKPLIVTSGSNAWGTRNLVAANNATVNTITNGLSWGITKTGSSNSADAGRSNADLTTLDIGALYLVTLDSSAPVNLSIYDGSFAHKTWVLSKNTMVFMAQAANKLYISPVAQNSEVIISNIRVEKIMQMCNTLTLSNTTIDRWAEIEGKLPNTQWAYNFDGIDDFAYFNTPIYLTGDFDISVTIEGIINTSSGQDFLGSELRLKFSIEPATGRPSFLVGNGSNWIINHVDSSVNLYNGARYVLRGTKVGNIYTYYINGEQKYQVTNSSPVTPQISFIGRRHNAPIGYVRGEIFNININGGNWKLDEIATPIQLPSTYLLSNELLSNSELLGALSTSLPSWTRFNTAGLSYENGGLKISNNAAQAAAIRQTINTVAGESYIVEFVVPDTSTTQARITVNSGSVGNYSAGLAGGNFSGSLIKQRIIFTATDTTTTIDIYCNTLDMNRYINLKSISIKALGSYGLELCSNRPEGNFINTNSSAVDFANSTARLTTVDMPVESNTNYLITSVGGISDRSRWQYRKVSDGLWYWGASSLDYKSVDSGILTLFTTPTDCNGLRIYYKSEAGTATNLSVKKVLNLTNPVIFNNMNSDRWVEVLE